jgi:hypothetical protein
MADHDDFHAVAPQLGDLNVHFVTSGQVASNTRNLRSAASACNALDTPCAE